MPRDEPSAVDFANPIVSGWFRRRLGDPTTAQARAWPPIANGESTLLLAPTGSGKTLAAFLVAIDRLLFGPASDGTRVLYVSPLKALAVDVERNLRGPLTEIVAAARREGAPVRDVSVGVRSGDTPASERTRLLRAPPNVLVTTPESLYLMLTSSARETLVSTELVIVDEIHSLVATKRGAHLALSLERLDQLRGAGASPLQRVGLSATQRPLDEAARFLGGHDGGRPRSVHVVDASGGKVFDLSIEVPIQESARRHAEAEERGVSAEGASSEGTSMWPSIHPRLLDLVRTHRSTMIFVNSRRLAERLAGALNELAGEEVCLAHHGSIAGDQRADIESRLKRGELPAIVATSSLELGIDMGAVDLVVQIEAPPTVASAMQRVGRAGHHVGATSKGIVFPKFRGDLLACAGVSRRMLQGQVEELRYPRNPLDVLAQHVVAMVSVQPWDVDELFAVVRRAAPFAELRRRSFDGVLEMLAGRYPSDRFAGLRPRITWQRKANRLEPRRSARLLSVTNAGTIADRGLFGVFLAGTERPVRVGELDEEMVFESRVGDVFVLGASSWRIREITHDRVNVDPAPGESGKMPFWRGDRPGRPMELGAEIGKLADAIATGSDEASLESLTRDHALGDAAARSLVAYIRSQSEASCVPTDRTIVVERFRDEIGDLRVVVLSPFGARVHAPWTIAVLAKIRGELGLEVDGMWTDDGMVFRYPDADAVPADQWFVPDPDEVEALVVSELPRTPLFATCFRECAARSLLLPRRAPGRRTPLWLQRRRASDLLSVASEHPEFPIVLEAHRECLRDVFDVPALVELLSRVSSGAIAVRHVDVPRASPFASSLLFAYVASFLYEGDAPVAERRAAALSLDSAQLAALLGEPELRDLLSLEVIADVERSLQHLSGSVPLRDADDVCDLLATLGDLSLEEIRRRRGAGDVDVDAALSRLCDEGRACAIELAGERRFIAAEDAGRARDALGVRVPADLPSPFLASEPDAVLRWVARYARTHGPFVGSDIEQRLGVPSRQVDAILERLESEGRVTRAEMLPGTTGCQWSDVNVLRRIKRRSLSKLRSEVEAVEPSVLQRFALEHHHVSAPLRGPDGLLSALEQLQGVPLSITVLEHDVLPARVEGFEPRDLDDACASGQVVWQGVAAGSGGPGKIAVFLAGDQPSLGAPPRLVGSRVAEAIRGALGDHGAMFFSDLARVVTGFPGELLEVLWEMVWSGEVTNDTLRPLRSRATPSVASSDALRRRYGARRPARSLPPGSEGRWSLVAARPTTTSDTERARGLVAQLLRRHGILTREAILREAVPGGFAAVYPVLRAMEEAGHVRRGYFVEGLGATQFALPGAETRLRGARRAEDGTANPTGAAVVLAATDPAVLSGVVLPWPHSLGRPGRHSGARVIVDDGVVTAFVAKGRRDVSCFVDPAAPGAGSALERMARALVHAARTDDRSSALIERVDARPVLGSVLELPLRQAGFEPCAHGMVYRASSAPPDD